MSTPSPARRCGDCKEVFPSKKAAKRHAIATGHSRAVAFCCRLCGESLGTLERYSDHVSATGHMSCTQCQLQFSSAFALSTHLQIVHGQHGLVKKCGQCGKNVPIEGVHLQCYSKPVPCPTCRLRFPNREELAQHVKIVSSCASCGICLRPLETLADHLWTSEKHPKCLPCKLGFGKAADLAQHNLSCEASANPPESSDNLVPSVESTVTTRTSTPFAAPDIQPSPQPSQHAVTRVDAGFPSWHCRSCLQEPCVDPVATTCGHLFCYGCLMRELGEKACCPVCGTKFFVRLDVEN